jgi:hypothetical protein
VGSGSKGHFPRLRKGCAMEFLMQYLVVLCVVLVVLLVREA